MSLLSRLGELRESATPEQIRNWFHLAQAGVIALFVGGVLYLRPKSGDSLIGKRESEKSKAGSGGAVRGPDLLAHSRIEKRKPLALPGIVIDGPPHEILGVSPQATEVEIQRAYREKMKQYHPDKIGSDGGKIAEALNRARDQLLKRSGR